MTILGQTVGSSANLSYLVVYLVVEHHATRAWDRREGSDHLGADGREGRDQLGLGQVVGSSTNLSYLVVCGVT